MKPALKSVLPLACLLILGLCACEQNITQRVDVHVSAPPVTRPSAQNTSVSGTTPAPASARPETPSASSTPARVSSSVPAAIASALPVIPLTPISGPSATPIYAQELELFATTIPDPEHTRSYDSRSIEIARVFWQKRYEKNSRNPYQVLRMYLDSALIAWHNEVLATKLNELVMHTKAPLLFPNFAQIDAQNIAKAKDSTIRSYFRGTLALNNYLISDFEQREPQLITTNSRGEFVTITGNDVVAKAPAFPKEGDSFKVHLLSNLSNKRAEVTMIYQRDGWKIDFWAINVLVDMAD